MAKKEIDFVIKVNNKQLDLTKTSFEQFDKVVKQAKKDLAALPLTDPRYQILSKDIKTAESAWKAAQKASKEFGDENEQSGGKVKSYSQQIRQATKDLVELEQQFGQNSKEYQDQAEKIKNLRDKQEELTRGTQKLDDALSNIPGPIGQIGSGLQQLEVVSQSAKSAFNSLGLGFKSFDQIVKTSGVGTLVLLLVTLVAAVIDAAKSFKPLQNAFAQLKDSVGAIFNALKPITDFLLNVFVGALKIVAGAINLVAEAFGGVNNGAAQASLELERSIKKQESLLTNYGQAIDAKLKELISAYKEFNEKKKKILDDDYQNEADRQGDIKILQLGYINFLKQNLADRDKLVKQFQTDIDKATRESEIRRTDNQRQSDRLTTKAQKQFIGESLRNELDFQKSKMKALKDDEAVLRGINTENARETLKANITSQELLRIEMAKIDAKGLQDFIAVQEEQDKKQRQYTREDIAARNERANQILELTTSLIKEENARNLQEAKDKLIILKESQRVELEQVALSGVSIKNLKEKQAAERKLAREEVRKAQIQFDANTIQLQINDEERNLREEMSRSADFYQRKRDLATQELDKDFKLADGNRDKEEEARTKHWERILAIDQEELGNITSNLELEYQGMYQVSAEAFQKLRDIEEAKYTEQQRGNEQNYEKMQALAKDHAKKMNMIDVEELNTMADLLERRAQARYDIEFGFFKKTREAEGIYYAARVKAAGDNIDLLQVLEQEHLKRLRDLNREELNTYLQYATQIMGAIQTVISDMSKNMALQQQLATERLTEAYIKQNELDKKTITNQTELEKKLLENKKKFAEEEDKLKKEAFEQNKKIQIAQAIIATLQGAVSAFTSLAVIPVVGPVLGGIAAAAALVFGYKQVDLIKQTSYQSSLALSNSESTGSGTSGGTGGGGATSPGNQLGRNYGEGGMIQGPLHAGGGVMVNAEGGEAIMTRGAVTMFAPLLSMMNQAGGGTSFSKSTIGGAKYDNPRITKEISEPQIIKTYVVSTDMTSEQQKQNRLKDLSTL